MNDKGGMSQTLTSERQDITGSLPTMPDFYDLFTSHQLEWIARSLGRYSEELVLEFYASYVATFISPIERRAAPAK